MKYNTLFFRKLGKMSQNLSSVAVVIDALRVKQCRRFNSMRARWFRLKIVGNIIVNKVREKKVMTIVPHCAQVIVFNTV